MGKPDKHLERYLARQEQSEGAAEMSAAAPAVPSVLASYLSRDVQAWIVRGLWVYMVAVIVWGTINRGMVTYLWFILKWSGIIFVAAMVLLFLGQHADNALKKDKRYWDSYWPDRDELAAEWEQNRENRRRG